jgi:tripartite-type tricarboxylate transporter receptor subunit TctC
MSKFTVAFASVLAFLLLAVAPASSAEDYPKRNITWIVTYSPGGGFDSMSRAVARSMKKFLPRGVNVIVKNITGAGGRTGAVTLYRSKPDGYTVGLLDEGGLVGFEMVMGAKKAGYEVDKYVYLGRIANEPYTIIAAAKSPLKSLEDLKKASRLTWGVEGIGLGRWLPAFLATKVLGIGFDVVSGYRGTGESLPGLIRGDFNLWLNPSDHPSVVPVLKSGDVRCVIHFGETRANICPDTPTAKELGYDFTTEILRLVAAPPGTPPERAKIFEGLLMKAMADEDFTKWAKASGSVVNPGNGAEAQRALRTMVKEVQKEQVNIKKILGK